MPEAAIGTGWFPVFTALLGYLTSLFTEFYREKRTSARELESRKATRRLQLSERRSNFQRETLLELQDAISQLARTHAQVHHLDTMERRKSGVWVHQVPEDLNQEAFAAMVKTLQLLVRVHDDPIRQMTQALRTHATGIVTHRMEEDSTRAMKGMLEVIQPLHERIGLVLRQLDDDEEATA